MLMLEPTRTLNPLHFEDMEPHRFEDMVRQIAYGFRNWRSIEAIGRSGSDEGMDIRAVEAFQDDGELVDDGDDDVARAVTKERVWVIQCKREKAIGPSRMAHIVAESLPGVADVLHGFILAAATDFSKRARDVFRGEMRKRGVEEFYLWGKGELEDMLFLPQNDHLLFAYFNISIQVRRRSLRSQVRSRLAIKRKLKAVLGDIRQHHFETVLLRDPSDSRYPWVDEVPHTETPPWRYYTFMGHWPPDHLAFVEHRYVAYLADDNKQWDALFACDLGMPTWPRGVGMGYLYDEQWEISSRYRAYWEKNVPQSNQAWLTDVRFIHYDRIIGVDEDGDTWHEGPHILVDYNSPSDPFEADVRRLIERGSGFAGQQFLVDEHKRVSFFPEHIPPQ